MIRLAAAFALLAGPASAQLLCAPYAEVSRHLATGWEERRVFEGVRRAGGALELWASGDYGSWTLVLHTDEGLACVVDAGVGAMVRLPGKGV